MRGIVQARVVAVDDRIRAAVNLIDASSNRVLVESEFEGLIGEMPTMRTEIAKELATALTSSTAAEAPPERLR